MSNLASSRWTALLQIAMYAGNSLETSVAQIFYSQNAQGRRQRLCTAHTPFTIPLQQPWNRQPVEIQL